MKSVDDYFASDRVPDPPPNGTVVPNMNGYDAGLPANVDAEKTILGAILLDNDAYIEIGDKLEPDDFSLDSHRRIFTRMSELLTDNHPVDIVTLSNRLAQEKEIEAVGGVAYLASLTEGLPRRPVVAEYIAIVKDKSLLRRMMIVCSNAIARAQDQSEPALEIIASTEEGITQAVESSLIHTEVFSSETLADDAEYRLLDCPPEDVALPTGLTGLDEWTSGGMRLGELWVVGSPPSRGKTTLARQIVKHTICRGTAVYVHSGEMTKESWYDITACLLVDMPAWKVREPRLLNLHEKDLLRTGLRELKTLPFYISDAGGITLDKLIWNGTREKKIHNIMLKVVDYAQIIDAPGKDDRAKVTAVAERLRRFAKDEGVVVMLLSSSPRPEGRSINARPSMFSLKESGQLEGAAHTVLLPYRPVDTETHEWTGEDELIIGKQRWGAIGSIPVYLNGKYLRFQERERKP